MVLARNILNGESMVQSRRASDGSKLKNLTMLREIFHSKRLTFAEDISGNGREEIAVLAEKLVDGRLLIKVRDYGTGRKTLSINP